MLLRHIFLDNLGKDFALNQAKCWDEISEVLFDSYRKFRYCAATVSWF